MAGTTFRAAADALVASARTALQCLAPVEILQSGWNLGVTNTLRVISRGDVSPGIVMLRRPDRSPYLQLKVSLDYSVILDASGPKRPAYRAEISRYIYVVQDLNANELFAYHWHPRGVSNVWTPHLHLSAARDVHLPSGPERHGGTELSLGKLHFPTHRIELAQLVRFLIIELEVGPRRSDWERVLDRH